MHVYLIYEFVANFDQEETKNCKALRSKLSLLLYDFETILKGQGWHGSSSIYGIERLREFLSKSSENFKLIFYEPFPASFS